jgi:hypothetical protein
MRRLVRVATFSLVAAVAALVPQVARAQGGQIGLLGGATFASLRGLDTFADFESRTGLIGGGYLLLPLSNALQLQLEGLVVNKGADARPGQDDAFKLSYAEVPVLLRLNLAPASPINPHVYAGPYLGFRIDCTIGGDTSCEDSPEVVSTASVDLGGTAGGGVAVDLGGLVLTGGARYSFGVSKLAEFDGSGVREAARHGAWAVYAGLGVRFGRR